MSTAYETRLDGVRTCSRCRQEWPLTAKYFRVRTDRPSGFGYTCKTCRSSEDKRRDRTERGPRKGRHCFMCSSLPHRRPRVGLCACGEAFVELAPKTLEETMAEPRNYDRMVAL